MAYAAEDDYDHLYKIILVGDPSVGKTHLLSRYTRGTLPKTQATTIGVEFATHTVPLAVGGTVKAQIWDTAGQERYRAITAAHFRQAVGALIVYDVTRKQSFLNASKWLEDVKQQADKDIVVMLVGNKVDLAEGNPHDRQVDFELARAYAEKNGLFFSEASALTTYNVKKVFEHLMQEIYNKQCSYTSPPTNVPGPNGSAPTRGALFRRDDADLRAGAFMLNEDDMPASKTGCC